MSIVHTREFELAFTRHKQADIATAVASAHILDKLPERGFAPTVQEQPAVVTDRSWYGKGHSHPTFNDVLQKMIRIPQRQYSMTQLSATVIPAFVLGSLATTQPSSGAAPTVYDNALSFQDPETNKEAIYTSMIEEAGAEYQKLLAGVVVNSFNLSCARNDHAVIGWEGFARTMADDVTALPNLAASQAFFKLLKAAFTFGSGAGSVVSSQVLAFNLSVSQNAKPWWLPGATAGQEHLIAKALIGDQTVSGSITFFLDNTLRNLFLNNTECILTVVFTSDQIGSTGLYNTVTITIPNLKISSESFAEEEQTAAYTLTFDENSVLQATGEDFFTWTVRSTIDGTELLVSA